MRIFVSEHDLYKLEVGSPTRIQVDGLWGKIGVPGFFKSAEIVRPLSCAGTPERLQGALTSNLLRRPYRSSIQFQSGRLRSLEFVAP